MTKTASAVRFVKTRDAATAILRKLGIKARDYAFFIEKTEGGRLAVQVAKAEMHLKQLAGNAAESGMVRAPKTEQKPAPEAKAEKKPRQTKAEETCSSVARDLIRAGKTNAEVWAVISVQFELDAKKRGYPAWYRFQLRKAGEKV